MSGGQVLAVEVPYKTLSSTLLTHCLLSTAIAVPALTMVPHKEFQSLLFSFKFLLLSDINFLHCSARS